MFQNYLKIAWRNLLKNRVLSIINIAGLSFSVAFCLLLYFYIRYEQSFDSFHVKKDQLFRLEMTSLNGPPPEAPKNDFFSFLKKDNETGNEVVVPLIVAGDMENTFPEIKSITRFKDLSNHYGDQLVKTGGQIYKERHVIYADNNFFTNLSFPLKKGNPASVLNGENIVVSESIAKKYFGTGDPIGKTISFVNDSNHLFTIAGIAEDAPANSSIQYSLVLPITADPGYAENIKERFNQSDHVYIIELAKGVSPIKFQKRLNAWVKNYYAEATKDSKDPRAASFHWYLRPLTDCHYVASYDWGHYSDEKKIYQLASLVTVILIIASLNYILLAISNAAARSREVGVRKVMGANRGEIIYQFWIETQILVLISVSAGLLLADLLLPLFDSLINAPLQFKSLPVLEILTASLGLAVLVGILAGYYPALFISKLRPVSIIKSFQTFRINPRFSKVLVVIQYTSCVVMMMAALVINQQMKFIAGKDLGFDKEQVLLVQNPVFDAHFAKRIGERLHDFAKSEPSVLQYSSMNGGLDGGGNISGFMLNGERIEFTRLSVGYDYFEMLKIPFLQGRSFSEKFPSDTAKASRSVVVNETLFNMLGSDATLGVFNKNIEATIIGVVKDYHFASLNKAIEPEMHSLLGSHSAAKFMFKIKAGQMQPAIEKIQKQWKSVTSNYPFEYTFLDQTITKMYAADLIWQKTIEASCFFAIFIACMGLFGLSAINAINRTREIGIRKVLGAGVGNVVGTLSKNFLAMILIAILIAVPVSWWIMNDWLADFAYRISISWWMFALVGCSAIAIAGITVSFQAVKAALANPVDTLRIE